MNDQKYVELPVELIDFKENNELIFGDEEQNRLENEQLAGSMDRVGFHGVIEVIQCENGRYKVIAGNRRLKKWIESGKKFIPSVILDVNDEKEAETIFIESNLLQRKLTPLMLGYALQTYMNDCLDSSLSDVAKRKIIYERFGYSDSSVRRYICLTRIIPELQKYASLRNFPYYTLSEAVALTEEEQLRLASDIDNEYKKQLSELKKDNDDVTEEDVTIPKSFVMFIINGIRQEKKRIEEGRKQKEIELQKEINFEQSISDNIPVQSDNLPIVKSIQSDNSVTISSDLSVISKDNAVGYKNPDMREDNRLDSFTQQRNVSGREVVTLSNTTHNDFLDNAIDMWNQQFDQLIGQTSIETSNKKVTLKKLDELQAKIDRIRAKLQ